MKRMFHPFTIHSVCSPSPSYPDGPARNPTSVQRGSVQFLSIYPGDPTTPGYPAYENATRTEGTNIPSIPSLAGSIIPSLKRQDTARSSTDEGSVKDAAAPKDSPSASVASDVGKQKGSKIRKDKKDKRKSTS